MVKYTDPDEKKVNKTSESKKQRSRSKLGADERVDENE
jgi:hypothetical protein